MNIIFLSLVIMAKYKLKLNETYEMSVLKDRIAKLLL